MIVQTVANQKGGVGKTAICCQQSFCFAERGLPTLLVELDHQCNARAMRNSPLVSVAGFTALDVLEGRWSELPPGELVLVPGDPGLSALERQPAKHNGYVNALRDFLEGVAERFAVCVIDTNPSPDVRYAAALLVADFLLSPVELNQEAIDGIATLLNHGRYGYHRIRETLNQRLQLLGILPNLVEATAFQRANLQQLILRHSNLLIPVRRGDVAGYAYIPNRTAMAEAQASGVPLWQLRQSVPEHLRGRVAPGAMPLRGAGREAWREIKPSFDAIAVRMGLGG